METERVRRLKFCRQRLVVRGFMEDQEATRTCGQCHKEVAETNFALHETHCSRFLCLCPDCGESVPREQLDQHREEEHTLVRCSKCNQKMERCQLMDHEAEECVERLQSCCFCELELPWKELDEHSLACGSRTELCRDCGRYVTLRQQPEHASTCTAADDDSGSPQSASTPPAARETVTMSCRGCSEPFPVEEIEQHELECVPAAGLDEAEGGEREVEGGEREGGEREVDSPPWLSRASMAASLSDGLSRGPWGDAGDPHQISTCPHCHLALPLLTLRWHKVKCQIYICLN
ncbi:XIAP-associated factor 1 [Cottoperca gobio]|uniref:XIAP-associated factor 1 n=1 Tax=Cottoperca gobio TaxID=56716 RepID=A0A6J2QWI4_COTGO|nr:XIAP-associated factor 1 [Cottoperca gobio]